MKNIEVGDLAYVTSGNYHYLRGRTLSVESITKNNEAIVRDTYNKEKFTVPVSALTYNPSTPPSQPVASLWNRLLSKLPGKS